MGDELRPDGLALAVAHLEAQQLPAAVLVHPHGDDDSAGADLPSLVEAALEVSGIQVGLGVAAALQGPAQKRLHLQCSAVVAIVDCHEQGQFIGFLSLKQSALQSIWVFQGVPN